MIEAYTDNKYISIYNFLKRNQNQFKPNLSEYTNLRKYAYKLSKNASNLFLKEGKNHLAHASFYINDLDLSLFISSFCVDRYSSKKGLGGELMDHIKQKIADLNFNFILLEVFIENIVAINFYKKHGFSVLNKTDNQLTLSFTRNE